MKLIDQLIEALQSGDAKRVAELFAEDGVLHDSSALRLGRSSRHLHGRMAIEISYHNRFGFNGGAFPMTGLSRRSDEMYYAFITYKTGTVACCLHLAEVKEGKICRLNLYPL